MTSILGFLLFILIVLGADKGLRWWSLRSQKRTPLVCMETSADDALRKSAVVAARRTAAVSIPPIVDSREDVTPVITLHPRKARPVPTEYRQVRPAKKST